MQHTQAGLWWPAADPDNLREAAAAWTRLAHELEAVQTAATAVVHATGAQNSGPSIDRFTAWWDQRWVGNAGALSNAIEGCKQMAEGLTKYAQEVDNARQQVEQLIAEVATASIIGIGLSIVTVGVSDVAAAGVAAGLVAMAESVGIGLSEAVVGIVTTVITGAAVGAAISAVSDMAVQIEREVVFHDNAPFNWGEVLTAGEFGAVGGAAGGSIGRVAETFGGALGSAPAWVVQPVLRVATGAGAAALTDELMTGGVNPLDVAFGGVGGLAAGFHGAPAEGDGEPSLTYPDLMNTWGDHLTDPNGRPVSEGDLHYVGVTPQQVDDALSARAPLGTTPEQWNAIQGDVNHALVNSGLGDVQVGVSGSSTKFWANPTKPFPTSPEEASAQAVAMGRDGAAAAAAYGQSPYAGGDHPTTHFFDSRAQMGIDEPSDIDFNIYGPQVDQRMHAWLAQHPDVTDYISSHGGVYKTRYLNEAFPELRAVTGQWSLPVSDGGLGRAVNVVAKPFAGWDAAPGSVWSLGRPAESLAGQ